MFTVTYKVHYQKRQNHARERTHYYNIRICTTGATYRIITYPLSFAKRASKFGAELYETIPMQHSNLVKPPFELSFSPFDCYLDSLLSVFSVQIPYATKFKLIPIHCLGRFISITPKPNSQQNSNQEKCAIGV